MGQGRADSSPSQKALRVRNDKFIECFLSKSLRAADRSIRATFGALGLKPRILVGLYGTTEEVAEKRTKLVIPGILFKKGRVSC